MLNEIDGDTVRHGLLWTEIIYWQCSGEIFLALLRKQK